MGRRRDGRRVTAPFAAATARYPRRLAGLALAVGFGLSGCAGDEADPGAGRSTTTAAPGSSSASSASSASSDSSSSTVGPSETSGPTAFAATARDAVNELKAAWESGDQARAAAIAPGEVIAALFPIPSDGFEVYQCDTGEFETSTCAYRNRSTGVFISVNAVRHPEGWQIGTIIVS